MAEVVHVNVFVLSLRPRNRTAGPSREHRSGLDSAAADKIDMIRPG